MTDPTAFPLAPEMPAVPAIAGALVPESGRDQLQRLLKEDTSRLGDVYRGIQAGLNAKEIADSLDVVSREVGDTPVGLVTA